MAAMSMPWRAHLQPHQGTGVANKGGRIFFTAGDGGSVAVSQKVVAHGASANGKAKARRDPRVRRHGEGERPLDARGEGGSGGTIVVTGRDITLASGAFLDVSGATGGHLAGGWGLSGRQGCRVQVSARGPWPPRRRRRWPPMPSCGRMVRRALAAGRGVVGSAHHFQGAISAGRGGGRRCGKCRARRCGLSPQRGSARASGFGTLLLDSL